MDIRDFCYSERFTDENYALFSEEELAEIEVLSAEETSGIWYSYCDKKELTRSLFVIKIVSHTLPILTVDCGWGDEKGEDDTRQLLKRTLREHLDGKINICYDSETALRVPVWLFCERWSDFCYAYDYYVLLDLGERALLYYDEDMMYFLEKRKGIKNLILSDVGAKIALNEIDSFEKYIGLTLPDDYKHFIMETNGGVSVDKLVFGYNSVITLRVTVSRFRQLFSFGNGKDENDVRNIYESLVKNRQIPSYLIPVGDDMEENVICISLEKDDFGTMYYCNLNKKDKETGLCIANRIAESFMGFIRALTVETE